MKQNKTPLNKNWIGFKIFALFVCVLIFAFGIVYKEVGAVLISFFIGAGFTWSLLEDETEDDTYDV